VSAYVSRVKRLEIDYEMKDNNNAYQRAQKNLKKNARIGRIRMWKTRAAAPARSVEVGGVGDTGNL
jgi:hypothetical protein